MRIRDVVGPAELKGISLPRSLVTLLFAMALPLLVQAAPASRPAEPPLPQDARQEAELLKVAGPGFQVIRTPHFLVAYDTSRPLVEELLGRLEDTYRSVYRFAGFIGIEARRPQKRLEVILFNRREEYDHYGAGLRFASGGTYGVYHEPTNRSAFFNVYNDPQLLQLRADIQASRENLQELTKEVKSLNGSQPLVLSYGNGRRERLTSAQAKRRLEDLQRDLKVLDGKRANYSERITRTVIQHEAAHQVLFNAGVHARGASNPKWVIEGLATMFETPPGEAGAGIATTNQLRLKDFRDALAGSSDRRLQTVGEFLEAIAAGRLEQPRRLISDPRVFDEREQRGARAYAMTWSLANYLQRCQPKKLAAYLREIAERKPGTTVSPEDELALFEKHFGKLDDVFLRQWGAYTLRLSYRPVGGL